MARPVGRPADEQHRRIAAMLRALTQRTRSALELKAAADLSTDRARDGTRFASDDRKFRRDLKALRTAGWHIEHVELPIGSRYQLRVIDHRIRQTFTESQRAELLRAAERAGIGQLYEDLDPTQTDGVPAEGPPGLGEAHHAVRHRCILRFRYRGKVRALHPDEVYYERDWYVRGWEEGTDEEVKTFRLNRVSELRVDSPGSAQPARELPPPSLNPGTWGTDEPITAVVDVDTDSLADFLAPLSEKSVRLRGAVAAPDGSEGTLERVEVLIVNHQAFLRWLIELGTRARLVGPPALREELAKILTSAGGAAR
jgi:predicted DNA-binding transcriptional regulator YafY